MNNIQLAKKAFRKIKKQKKEVLSGKPRELKVGDRVSGITEEDGEILDEYTGVVYKISDCETGDRAYIKRDDKRNGSGAHAPGYGDTWEVYKEEGCWGADGDNGYLTFEDGTQILV